MLRLSRILIVAWCVGVCAPVVGAQIGSGTITGSVTDQAGAVVSGAAIRAVDVATNRTRATTSNGVGMYTLTALPPGTYRVEFELSGFATFRREGIIVATGDTARVDVVLTVGTISEEVTVSDAAPPLRADTAGIARTVEHQSIVRLPLNGRTFIGLAALAPGVSLPPGSQLPRINGGRPRTNEYLYDGISVLQPEPGQVAFFPVIDAIQEFTIASNSPPAEFGRFNGGVVNLITRSGSNAFRGDVFDFARHEALNARNVFQSTSARKPAYRRQQFGGVHGGPIVRDRTFFFVDYQGQRQRVGRTAISTVPTLLQRSGEFTEPIAGRVPVIYDPAATTPLGDGGYARTPFAGNAIPADHMDPVARALLDRYPLPTSAGTANNYQRTADETDDQDQWDVRLDHTIGARDQAFARLSRFADRFTPVAPLPDGSGAASGTPGPQHTGAWALASNERHTFTAALLNEFRGGYTSRRVDRRAATLAEPAAAAIGLRGLPSNAAFADVLPTIAISGYQQLGSPPNTATAFDTSVSELTDTLTWVHGRHTVKGGFDWRWERLNVVQPPSPAGSFSFNALGSDLPGATGTGTPLASFLLGQVQSFSIDVQRSAIQERAHIQEYFAQDDWAISAHTTVNAGLRYTLNFPSTEINGQTAVFNLQTERLEYPGTAPVRRLAKDNLGPRAGIVHRISEKTIASSGYGLVWIEMAGITTPFTTPAFPFLQTVSQRALDTVTPAFRLQDGSTVAPIEPTPYAGLGQGVFAVDRTLGSGYVQQWNASVQREVAKNLSVEVAYVGSHITRVGIPDSNLNQLTPDELALGPALLQRVPNPYFGIIPRSSSLGDPTLPVAQLLKPYPQYTTVSLYRNNVGTTRYDGLEVSVRRRLARGWSWSAAYTRSRLVDDASSVFDASVLTGPVANYPIADSHNLRLERDHSTGDIPHVFVSSVVWDLPAGAGRGRNPGGLAGMLLNDWSLTGVITLQSGTPIAITQATNFNAFAGFGVQRPNLVADPTLPADQRSASQWFNTAAFTVAPQFTLGTSPRNPVRGPSYRNLDVALIRKVPTSSRTAIDLRIEVFNALNTPALGSPGAVLGAANFGTITSAGDPRVAQLALKIAF